MNLDFSEEQEALREMVRGVCADYAPLEVVRKVEDDATGYPFDFWKQLGELGLLGLTLPEEHGGADQSALEAAIVYEEFGRALSPSPHFVSSSLCGGALVRAGSEEQRRAWLPEIATGDAILTPAWLEPKRGFGPEGVQLRAVAEGGDYRLSGTKLHVPFASAADRLLVLARTGDGERDVELLLVDPRSPGVEMTQQLSLASDTQYRVDLHDVRVPASDRVGASCSRPRRSAGPSARSR
jgi:alkylation response protein AidB-like acyl-CoA dehydrogenase